MLDRGCEIVVGIYQFVANWENLRIGFFAFPIRNSQTGCNLHLCAKITTINQRFCPLLSKYLHAHHTRQIAKELAAHLGLVFDQAGHRGTERSGTLIAITLKRSEERGSVDVEIV